MIHKLILVEGLPGSGKSTTSQKLAHDLRKNNVSAKWYSEDELEHPTDHQCEACFTFEEYAAFLKSIDSGTRIVVERHVRRLNDYYLINYHRLYREFPNLNIRDELSRYNVFSSSTERFVNAFLHKWNAFSDSDPVHVSVLDASFLQLPLTALLLTNDECDDVIFGYIKQIVSISLKMRPVLIYFDNPDVEAAISQIFSVRGERWKDYIIRMVESSKYSINRGLTGMNAVIYYFQHRYHLEQRIMSQLDFHVIRLNKSSGDWKDYCIK